MCSIFNNIFGFFVRLTLVKTKPRVIGFFFLVRPEEFSLIFGCIEIQTVFAVLKLLSLLLLYVVVVRYFCFKRINILSVCYWISPTYQSHRSKEITSQAQNSSLHQCTRNFMSNWPRQKKIWKNYLSPQTTWLHFFDFIQSIYIYIKWNTRRQQFSIEYSFDVFNPFLVKFCISVSKSKGKICILIEIG